MSNFYIKVTVIPNISKKVLSIFHVLDLKSESERKSKKTANTLVVLFIQKINYFS